MQALIVSGFSVHKNVLQKQVIVNSNPYSFLISEKDEPKIIYYNEKKDILNFISFGKDYFIYFNDRNSGYKVDESFVPNLKKRYKTSDILPDIPLFKNDAIEVFKSGDFYNGEYVFEDIKTGKKLKYKTDDVFLVVKEENIYMFSNENSSIYELNLNFNNLRERVT